jgi:hypothetical protein
MVELRDSNRWPSRALGDLELILSSPVNARSVLATRAFSITIDARASVLSFWPADGRVDAGGQRRDEPTRGLELRNEARSLSRSSGRNRLGTPLRVDRWRIARLSAGLGAAACDIVLGGWSRRRGRQRGRGFVTPRIVPSGHRRSKPSAASKLAQLSPAPNLAPMRGVETLVRPAVLERRDRGDVVGPRRCHPQQGEDERPVILKLRPRFNETSETMRARHTNLE